MSDEGKLFIGGLSFETNEESLAAAFGKYGTIEKVDVIRDKETGRSRGFGFVKYDNADDAKDAMTAMNGKSLDGRAIRVDEAGKGGRSRGGFSSTQRGGRFGGSRGRGGRGYSRGGYNGERSYGGERNYGDRCFGSEGRSFGGSGGGYRSGGGGGYSSSGYRDNRGQGGYSDRSGTYRDGYDGYAAHELNGLSEGSLDHLSAEVCGLRWQQLMQLSGPTCCSSSGVAVSSGYMEEPPRILPPKMFEYQTLSSLKDIFSNVRAAIQSP